MIETAGYYWVKVFGDNPPVVAELSFIGNWYICGIDGAIESIQVEVISEKLEPPSVD